MQYALHRLALQRILSRLPSSWPVAQPSVCGSTFTQPATLLLLDDHLILSCPVLRPLARRLELAHSRTPWHWLCSKPAMPRPICMRRVWLSALFPPYTASSLHSSPSDHRQRRAHFDTAAACLGLPETASKCPGPARRLRVERMAFLKALFLYELLSNKKTLLTAAECKWAVR